MPYGILKCDTITFTSSGVDKSVSISGLVQNPTFSGNITSTGTISGVTIQGGTLVSGATVTGSAGQFTTATVVTGVFASGTAAAPSITFAGDSNTGLYSPGADQVAISTSGTGRLFIDSSGRQLAGTSAAITTMGSPAGGITPQQQLVGSSFATASAAIIRSQGGSAQLFIAAGSSVANVLSGDRIGGIYFDGYHTDGYYQAASIEGNVDGTPGTNDMPGRLVFSTTADGASSPTERLRITSDGKVGVGTSAPSQQLDVRGPVGNTAYFAAFGDASLPRILVGYNPTGGAGTTDAAAISADSIGSLNLFTRTGVANNIILGTSTGTGAAVERARIDSSGRLLVGTSAGRTIGTGNFQIQAEGTGAESGISLTRNTSSSASSNLRFVKSRGTTAGSTTIVQSGDDLGVLSWWGTDAVGAVEAVNIKAVVDGIPGTNDMPGRLVFSTTADGASTPTERMRITSSGNVLIGTTSTTANGGVLQVSNGITFPATQSACSDANTLDDYEEGVFTPTVAGSSTTGVGTYTVQSGKYIKTGGLVYIEVAMTWTAHTGTGQLWFTSLPFASPSTGNGPGVSFGRISNIALTANNLLLGYVASNSTIIPLRQYPVGGGAEATVPLDTAGEVNFSVSYMVV
jgi:hypothetical protein